MQTEVTERRYFVRSWWENIMCMSVGRNSTGIQTRDKGRVGHCSLTDGSRLDRGSCNMTHCQPQWWSP